MLLGFYVAQLYVNNYAELLKESNLTWADIQVEKQVIKQQEPIFWFVSLITIAIVILICNLS